MNFSKNLILLKIFNLTVITLILYFSTINLNVIRIDEENLPNDKILHLVAYVILSLSTVLARWDIISEKNQGTLSKNKVTAQKYSIVIILCFVYGTVIEFIQEILPSRNFDILDIISNGVGIFLGVFFYFILSKFSESSNIRL